jgi:hypothetical protein
MLENDICYGQSLVNDVRLFLPSAYSPTPIEASALDIITPRCLKRSPYVAGHGNPGG